MSSASVAGLPPDESRGYIINIVGWVGAAIATVFVALRVYSRLFVTRSPGWDDAIIVFATILNLITTALNTVAISYGIGRHIYYLSNDDIVNTLYYGAILRPFGISAFCLPKLAVVILIIKLMGTEKRGVWFLYSVIAILFVTSGLSFILLFAQCDPPNHLWHPFSPANCFPNHVLDGFTYLAGCEYRNPFDFEDIKTWKLKSLLFSAWSAFTDFILAVFPITVFWNLQMKRSKKISVMLLMGLGFFAMIAAIVKTTQLPANHAEDATWDLFGLFITTYIETDLVIMAACAPALPRLVLKILGRDTEASPKKASDPQNNKPTFHGYEAFDAQHASIGMDSMRADTLPQSQWQPQYQWQPQNQWQR